MKKIFIVVSLVVLIVNIIACGENKTVEQYLASANKYRLDDNFSSAVIELKHAVRIAPKHAYARLFLGQAYLRQGHYINAEKELERALSLGIDFFVLVADLVQVKTKLNKAAEVYQLVQQSHQLSDENFIIVLTFAGIAALYEDDFTKAQDYFSQAIAIQEEAAYSKIAKAYLAKSDAEYQLSLNEIDSLISDDSPPLAEALLLKGHLLSALRFHSEAVIAFSQYIALRPKDYYIRFFQVDNLIRSGNTEQADESLAVLLEIYKNVPLVFQYKAEIAYKNKNFEDAKSFAERALQGDSVSKVATLIAGVSAYQLKEYEQAYVQLMSIDKYLSSAHPAKRIIAILKMKLGYISSATESFLSLSPHADDLPLLKAASFELSKLKHFDGASKILAKAEKQHPNSATIHAQKGLLLLSKRDLKGVQALERALQIDPHLTDVELALALQYLKTDKEAQAQAIANKSIESTQRKAAGYLLQGVIQAKKNNHSAAKTSFEQVLLLEPTSIPALYNLALYQEHEDNIDAAASYYERILVIDPSHNGSLNRLTGLRVKTAAIDKNVDFFEKLIVKHPSSIDARIAFANILHLEGKSQQAIAILEEMPKSAAFSAMYWLVLGDNYLQANKIDKAKEVYSKALKQYPNSYLLHLRVIGVLDTIKEYHSALNASKKAIDIFADDVRLATLLTHYTLLNGQFEQARIKAQALVDKGVDSALLTMDIAQLAVIDGDYKTAISHYLDVYHQFPHDHVVISLARSYKLNNQQAQAEKLLEIYLKHNPDNTAIRLLLTDLYEQESPSKAIVQYQILLSEQPNHFVFLNNIAWAYYRVGNISKALTNSQQAFALEPEHLNVLETYGVVLFAVKQDDIARAVLIKALEKGSKDLHAQIALAELHIRAGQWQQAKSLLVPLTVKDKAMKNNIARLLAKIK